MDKSETERLEAIKQRVHEPRYCEHAHFKGHHIECVSPIKRVRWYQCLDCGAVFAPTPYSD
jgi:hypothetical protein